VQKNINPLFPENYKTFTKNEFLLDADIEFSKLKYFLNKNPKVLKEDPMVGVDYIKVLDLIKRKRVYENAADPFDVSGQAHTVYHDMAEIDRQHQARSDMQL
jgi:hypothetical protein